MKCKIRIFAIVIILIVVAIYIFPDSQTVIEQKFDTNKEQFEVLAGYLENEPFKSQDIVRIDIFDSIVNVKCSKKDETRGGYNNVVFHVEEKEILTALEMLKKKGVIRILKEHEDLYFQVKSTFVKSEGVVYSPDGYPLLTDYGLMEVEIKETQLLGWYYYKFIYSE